MQNLTPREVGTILLRNLNLPKFTRSFTLRVTPEDAVVTLEYDPDPDTMEVITAQFDLVPRHDPQN